MKGSAMHKLVRLIRDSRGATVIEYGLIAGLIAIAAITAMSQLGTNLRKPFNNVSNTLNNATPV
jgi:pilus assembly protein Flp/PilA